MEEPTTATETCSGKRAREDAVSDEMSPETAKRLHAEILLDILDDVGDGPSGTAGELATVMRSLEEEIALPSHVSVEDFDAGSSRKVELGYLLEATDDDLGLPPTLSSEHDHDYENRLGDEEARPYDAFDLGIDCADDATEFLFPAGYFDEGYAEFFQTDLTWLPEFLPAV